MYVRNKKTLHYIIAVLVVAIVGATATMMMLGNWLKDEDFKETQPETIEQTTEPTEDEMEPDLEKADSNDSDVEPEETDSTDNNSEKEEETEVQLQTKKRIIQNAQIISEDSTVTGPAKDSSKKHDEDEREDNNNHVQPHTHNGVKISEKCEFLGNGRHRIIIEYKCKQCGEIYEEAKQEEACKYEFVGYETGMKEVHYNVSICIKCQYQIKRQEEHQFNKLPAKYVSLENGTHLVIIAYECQECRYIYEPLQRTEECKYEEWKDAGDGKEISICNLCYSEKIRLPEKPNHEFIAISTKYESKEDGTHEVTVEYKCTKCEERYGETQIENCDYGEWQYAGNEEDISNCTKCAYSKKRAHIHEFVISIRYESQVNGTHMVIKNYHCSKCGYEEEKTTEEDCEYWGKWQYAGDGKDTTSCQKCGYQNERNHKHDEAPENLTYLFDSSNGDGTHKSKASYKCQSCQEMVEVYKDEECEYEISSYSYEKVGINDTHYKVNVCKICQHINKEEDSCVPAEELKYITVGSQIYEYYDCVLCGDWCKRKYHKHLDVIWQYYNEWNHSGYCICGSGRKEEPHEWKYVDNGDGTASISCDICQYAEPVAVHEHGEGLYDGMDLFKLVTHPTYQLDKIQQSTPTQIYNQNPTTDSYCYKYEFLCHLCKKKYYIHYNHSLKDGFCTRGNCKLKQETESITEVEAEKSVTEVEAEMEVEESATEVEAEMEVEESATEVEAEMEVEESATEIEASVDVKEITPEAEAEAEVEKSTPETETGVDVKESTPEAEAEMDVKESTAEIEAEESATETETGVDVKEITPEAEAEMDVKETTPEAKAKVDVKESTFETEAEVMTDKAKSYDIEENLVSEKIKRIMSMPPIFYYY